MSEPQELFCHNCDMYVQFRLEMEVDGNYEIECPNCGHMHYRVVKNGVITDVRWASANRIINWQRVVSSCSAASVYTACIGMSSSGTGDFFNYADRKSVV